MSSWIDLLEIASIQHGAVSRLQARHLGVDRHQVRRHIVSGDLRAATDQVLVCSGAPRTPLQALMVALLDVGAGGCISHSTTLALFGIPGFTLAPVHVTHPRGGNRHDDRDAIVHTSRTLGPRHITVLDGIPTVTPTRALFDLAGHLHPGRTERCLDALWTRRLTDANRLAAALDDLAQRGRAGIQLMRSLIEARGPGYLAPESGLEFRFLSIVEDDGQTALSLQVTIETAEGAVRVDAVDTAAWLIIEIDSDLHHRSLSDVEADERRDRLLTDLGYTILRISEHDIWRDPTGVALRVRRARNEGRRRRGMPPCR